MNVIIVIKFLVRLSARKHQILLTKSRTLICDSIMNI
jgi:hypothetical protein